MLINRFNQHLAKGWRVCYYGSMSMNRRKFIAGAVAGAAVLSAGGVAWVSVEPSSELLQIDGSLEKLEKLMSAASVTTGEWNLYQVLIHCAQSVEYSMIGYPEHKPDLFKNTVGKLAFSAFSAKGKMKHGLNEIIPGAPSFSTEENIQLAYERFKKSLIDFKEYDGPLAQHFAYGQLSKAQYEKAHVMHFNNHLTEIEGIVT